MPKPFKFLPAISLAAAALGLAVLTVAATAQTAATPPPSKPKAGTAIVITVNGQPITESDIRLADAEIGAQLGKYPPKVRRKVLLEFLIENQLFASATDQAKIVETPAFKERMQYWRRRILRKAYFENIIQKSITEADAKAFYNEKVANVKGGTEVKASHILVASEDKAKELYEKIAHGADFSEMAKKHSTDPGSKNNGGSLGYFGKGRMLPVFETAAFQLNVGEVSLPVKSRYGWHIIKVEDKRDRKPPPFAALKDRIIAALVQKKGSELGKALRQKADIIHTNPEPEAPAKLPFTAAPPAKK